MNSSVNNRPDRKGVGFRRGLAAENAGVQGCPHSYAKGWFDATEAGCFLGFIDRQTAWYKDKTKALKKCSVRSRVIIAQSGRQSIPRLHLTSEEFVAAIKRFGEACQRILSSFHIQDGHNRV